MNRVTDNDQFNQALSPLSQQQPQVQSPQLPQAPQQQNFPQQHQSQQKEKEQDQEMISQQARSAPNSPKLISIVPTFNVNEKPKKFPDLIDKEEKIDKNIMDAKYGKKYQYQSETKR